jgi:16S rRNA (adenine1518-N6/adenine1519-N6)-dimethyltransferase
MNSEQEKCQAELDEHGLIPRKYYGQVFTTDPLLIKKFVQTVRNAYKKGTKIVEVGGGMGYITSELAKSFDDIDVVEFDEALFDVLNKKFAQESNIRLIKGDILDYDPPNKPYMLVGNIPFHISGRLYRKFMSEIEHKPYAMVFITDKQYASTLMGQPPRCYRVSLQAQSYGDIEILADVPPKNVYPEPKVMSCIMKITQNDTVLPKNFWKVVNYHWENFPTVQVKSPKTVGLKGWIELARKT